MVDTPPPPPPIDPDELHQREMLNEAVVNKWAAQINGVVSSGPPDPPPAAKPLEWYTMLWDVTMPTTVIPGVVPALELRIATSETFPDGPGGTVEDLSAVGSLPRKQRYATSYALWIVAPKASRLLGTLAVDVDFSDAQQITATSGPPMSSSAYYEYPATNITGPVFALLNGAFPPGGLLTKQKPPVVDVHLETVTVDLALDVHVPHWFDATATVGITWDVYGRVPEVPSPDADANIVCFISAANTNIATGIASAIISADIAGLVAYVAENESDQFLLQLVGPLVAQDLLDILADQRDRHRPNNQWYLHHMDVDPVNFTFWYCEKPAATPPGTGTPPSHPTRSG